MSEVTLDFIALLRRLVADVPSRGATLNAALQQLASQELRDLEPDASLLEALLSVPTTVRDSFSADDLYKWHTLLTGVLQIPEVVSAAPAAAAYATDALIDGAFARAALPPAEETAQAMTPGSSLPGCVSMVSTGASSASTRTAARVGGPGGGAAAGSARARPAGPRARPSAPISDATPQAAQAAELGAVRALLHWLYRSGDVVVRLRLRSALGTSALRLCSSSLPPPGLRVLLEVLASIIRGFGASRPAHRSLLLNVLVPLHRPAARMDETTPVLSLYHESLVHCMLCLLRARPEWLLAALPPLLGAWPEPREGLSSKEVLLLHELERLLELASPAQRPAVSLAAAPVLARCISSDNSRVAERALTIFASDGARATLTSDFDGCVPLLLGALVRGGVPHWNATVNKMTHEALRLLSEADAGGFAAAAKQIFSTLGDASLGGTGAGESGASQPAPPASATPSGYVPMAAPWASARPPVAVPLGRPLAVGAAAGSGGGGGVPPPLKKGFDPYSRVPARSVPPSTRQRAPLVATAAAVEGCGGSSGSGSSGSSGSSRGGFSLDFGAVTEAAARASETLLVEGAAAEPMATDSLGGDAPGATSGLPEASKVYSTLYRSMAPPPPPPPPPPFSPFTATPAALAAAGAAAAGAAAGALAGASTHPAVRMVFEYMHRIAPSPESLAAHAAPPAYVKEHLTAAPQLLPSIIFQELVFGRDLGSGSFSTVRYCKHVQRGTPAVSWPEYAAKVLCRQLLSQLGYEHAVRREIVVLRHLQHPGIARLVASFRWKEDIYLLLEYAAFGDLHGHLRRMGSLALPNARWLFAEVAAALAAVHAAGFAYGDLKPENILLTASGHAKLTDFGAARPLVGHEGALGVLAAAGNVIQELRDGDWSARRSAERRAAGATDDSPMGDAAAAGGAAAAAAAAGVAERGADCDAAAVGDDGRLEGTAAYLSPEIVTGGQPSEASDLWAFGCTLYQALCGRPPLWADTQEETMKRIVKFERVAEAQYPEQVPADARALIGSLLTPDPALRLRSIAGSATREGADGSSAAGAGVEGLAAVRGHPFFEGLDGDTLYVQTPPPLTRGAAAPQPHAAWSRRQNSIMWSPLPQRYAFGEDEGLALEPLVEGDEAGGSFTRPLTTNAEAAQAAEALRVPAPSESVCPPKTLAPMQETAEEHESEAMEA